MKNIIILITHYNNIDGLKKTLKSVAESFKIDVMIVDDGSIKRPIFSDISPFYTNGDIYLEYLNKNSGISIAANKGIKRIEQLGYEIIARLDCGDICYPNRFSKQLRHLNNNPETKILGGWAAIKNSKGELQYILKHPTDYNIIKKKMYLNSMFVNPTVVFYTEIAKEIGYYDENYSRAAQDYAFFFEAIKKYKAENIPEVLIDYYIEERSVSTTRRRLQVKNRVKIIAKHFYFGFYPVFGILRNLPLLMLKRSVTVYIKKIIS
jgi:hypothetical protein